ncbi:MAG: ABC transporter permease [Burkholderiaceae bacterium]
MSLNLNDSVSTAVLDIRQALARTSVVGALGWQDIRQRYKRSALGPFWLTISMGILIMTIGIVFGRLFKAPASEFLPFLACGLILWGFIATVVNDGCRGFISAEGMIKQLPLPLFMHVMRLIWRNMLMTAHNLIILPVVMLVVGKPASWTLILSLPGVVLMTLNLTWIVLILSVVCARYRDLPQLVGSVIQVLFYLTPVIWMPSLMPERAGALLIGLNPAFHLIEVVRAPLLGNVPALQSYLVCLILAVLGWIAALLIYGRFKTRVAYWL